MIHLTVTHFQGHLILDAFVQDLRFATDLLYKFLEGWKWENGQLSDTFNIQLSFCCRGDWHTSCATPGDRNT